MEITTLRTAPQNTHSLAKYKKIDKDTYVNTETGEVGYYHHDPSGVKTPENLRESFRNLKRLISHNFPSGVVTLHLIATYEAPQWDAKQLVQDATEFCRTLRRRYPKLAYVWVAEPHESGAWHLHIICKSTRPCFLYWWP